MAGRDFKVRPTVNGAPLAFLSEAGGGSAIPTGSFSPGSLTLETEEYGIFYARMTLSGADILRLEGTSVLRGLKA